MTLRPVDRSTVSAKDNLCTVIFQECTSHVPESHPVSVGFSTTIVNDTKSVKYHLNYNVLSFSNSSVLQPPLYTIYS